MRGIAGHARRNQLPLDWLQQLPVIFLLRPPRFNAASVIILHTTISAVSITASRATSIFAPQSDTPQIQYSTFEKHFHPRVQVWAVNPAPNQHLKSTSKKAIRIYLLISFHSGDVDAIVPFTGTRSWLDKLALPVEAAFRPGSWGSKLVVM